MKVIFHENQLCYRGTTNAMFHYALENQQILGNESIVIYEKNNPNNFPQAVELFKKNFAVYSYSHLSEIKKIIKETQSDVLYVINSGKKSDIISDDIKTVIHAVFKNHEPHGDVYAYVSKWLSDEMTSGNAPYVPHMISLPDEESDLRTILGIPKDAIVFGRHGGAETFDIKFAKNIIKKISRKRKDIFFLFLGTDPFVKSNFFYKYENIIYLNGTSDPKYISRFINTCDAYLHARTSGETFGIAIGEFSIKNKPIITWGLSDERCHLDILGNKAIIYNNADDLRRIISEFDKEYMKKQDWDCYTKEFNKLSVMKKFDDVFLKSN
ncbi:hypothetical protein SOV92_17820 [Pectobacterium brasiliense]|uniref:Glycosyl transferase family 1 domain-containing protein n=1 Tax=Pectobacterium brasiliense TaxID=180957 RepID=A0AAW9HGS5_9GAMM|nr:hypothetical protein [Pectobacterium brasiliense]MBN3098618.1 hypothetical protein [Pectobacterium brasiliense]MBN3164241.1 hypothetical protein [Pectobacterium brasiliense]MBN3180948.1 hypothetical protein [Pectobacterium brasiliense]MBN3344415.1 hypothetical protein [Pectobacterium brasiliense]MDY4379658.1 hypothetical protein [Pectobacterium brasiliense]